MRLVNRKAAHVPLLLGMLLLLPMACSGDDGAAGAAGASTGTLTGTVLNSTNPGMPVAGAVLTIDPAPLGGPVTTNQNGVFVVELPVGSYTVECSATWFENHSEQFSILAGRVQTVNMNMVPVASVVIEINGAPGHVSPGGAFDLSADVVVLDGSTVQDYQWTQSGPTVANIANGTARTTGVTLADSAAYKQALIGVLQPQERFAVLGIDPYALEVAAAVTFECEVTTTSGTYVADVEVHADLDFARRSSGLRNVPVGVPVLLGSKTQASYDWTLTGAMGSTVTLRDPTTANPWFVPDVAGQYVLTVTDQGQSQQVTIDVFAAKWVGAIVSMDPSGRPLTDCATACHAGIFPDKFADWARSGHAEIFTDNVNTGGHYTTGCFACHTVGYDLLADNDGMDDTPDYDVFLQTMFPGGQSHPNPGNWLNILTHFEDQARMANIQCENCHGPNGTNGGHTRGLSHSTGARVDTSSYVCAQCHGEPMRHARFQQWQQSGHGNYVVAREEGTRGSCAKCHTAQGFLEWFDNGLSTSYSTSAVDLDAIEPITCVVCHDPHNVGTTSNVNNNVTMRVEGDTPPLLAGFTATGLGHGAQCVVCHNTRRGLANDTVGLAVPNRPDQAPHGGAQGDVLMGHNAFFVDVGFRSDHSLIEHTCTTCHMELSPPPANLSHNLGGTNHTFGASTAVCAECHGAFNARSLISIMDSRLHTLEFEIERAIGAEIALHTGMGNTVQVTGEVGGVSGVLVEITQTSVIQSIELTEYHGRSAMNIQVDGTLVEHVRLGSDTNIAATNGVSGNLLANDAPGNEGLNLAKACWNYFLLHNDGSHGIHNPDFADRIITSTLGVIATVWP